MNLLDLETPGNVNTFSKWLEDLASFSPLELEREKMEKYLVLPEVTMPAKFSNADIDTGLFIANGQNVVVWIAIFITLTVPLGVLYVLKRLC